MKSRINGRTLGFIIIVFAVLIVGSWGFTAALKQNGNDAKNLHSDDEILVVTSFFPMYVTALNLLDGVEGVRLVNLSEPQSGCLHDYQLVPADMELLSQADVFIINGGGMESFLGDVTGAYPDMLVIDTSRDIVSSNGALEAEAVEDHEGAEADGEQAANESVEEQDEHGTDGEHEGHEEEEEHDITHRHNGHESHSHGSLNAHFWMSVPLYRKQVEAMGEGLVGYLSQNGKKEPGAVVSKNEKAYLLAIDELIAKQEPLRKEWSGQKVILLHDAFNYVATDYGMSVSFLMNLDEERQISAGEVASVVQEAEDGSRTIFAEEQFGKEMAETIQKEEDVDVTYLDTIVRADGTQVKDAYLVRMGANMERLSK